jgi:hypothetical protein
MTEPTRSRSRTAALASARAAGAVVAIGVAIVTVGAAVVLPLPTIAVDAPSTVITPVSTPQSLVCPGSFLRLGNAQGEDATTATAVGAATVSTGGNPTVTALAGTGAPSSITAGADATVSVSGSQVENLNATDVTGFAADSCSNVASDSWLVGGSNAVGRTTLVSLSNPSDVAATVSLELWGEAGAISASGSGGIVVDPKSQRVIALSGLARDVASPVVHVESTGGLISASLQQSLVRGLEPAGADVIGATEGPSLAPVIPGVVVNHLDDVETRIGEDSTGGSADLATVLRLLVPSGDDGKATVNVTPVGKGSGASFDVDVAAGSVRDVPLDGLEEGEYTVAVQSSVPVVGAVRVSTASSGDPAPGSSDFAWVVAPPRIGAATSVTVVDGPSPALHIVNPTDAAVDATLTDGTGAAQTVTVEPGATQSLKVRPGAYALAGTGAIVADVSYTGASQLAVYPVQPRVADADPIRVYP